MKNLAVAAFLLTLGSPAACFAQGNAQVPPADPCGDSNLLATTDRPTFGTNPCVVKPQSVVAEFGYKNSILSSPTGTSITSAAPNNRDRIGLLPHVELVLDLPSSLRTAAAGGVTSASSSLGTGLKYEFGYFGAFVHGIAAEATYPTDSTIAPSGLPSFNGSYQIGGPIVRNVGFNLTLGFDSFATPNPAGGKNLGTTAFAPTLIVGGAVAPATKLNVEVANFSSSGPGTAGRYYGNVFLVHQFATSLLIDVEAAERLTLVNGAHEHYLGAGGSIRL